MEENKTHVIVPFESPTFLEIFELEAIPLLRQDYTFTYEKETQGDKSVIVIIIDVADDRKFCAKIAEIYLGLLQGLKTTDE